MRRIRLYIMQAYAKLLTANMICFLLENPTVVRQALELGILQICNRN